MIGKGVLFEQREAVGAGETTGKRMVLHRKCTEMTRDGVEKCGENEAGGSSARDSVDASAAKGEGIFVTFLPAQDRVQIDNFADNVTGTRFGRRQ